MQLKNENDILSEFDTLNAQVRDLKSQLAAKTTPTPAGPNPSASPVASPVASPAPEGSAAKTLLEKYAAISSPREMAIFMKDNAEAITELLRTGSTSIALAPQVSLGALEAEYAKLSTDSERADFLRLHDEAIRRAA